MKRIGRSGFGRMKGGRSGMHKEGGDRGRRVAWEEVKGDSKLASTPVVKVNTDIGVGGILNGGMDKGGFVPWASKYNGSS